MMSPPTTNPGVDVVLCLRSEQLLAFPGLDGLSRTLAQDLDWAAMDATVHLLSVDLDDPTPPSGGEDGLRIINVESMAAALKSVWLGSTIRERDLLIVCGLAIPSADTIHHLQEVVRRDALTGVAVPRLTSGRGDKIWTLAGDDEQRLTFDARSVKDMKPTYIVSEAFEPVFLVRSDVVASIAPPKSLSGPVGVVRLFMAELRRAGFVTVIDNNARVPAIGSPQSMTNDLGQDTLGPILTRYPCISEARRRITLDDNVRFERLNAAITQTDGMPAIVYDCRNMEPRFNGTAVSILAFLHGLTELSDAPADILVRPDARKKHELDQRFPTLRFMTDVGDRRFDACMRLSQVWTVDLWRDMHDMATSVGCAMLDCIGIDIVYASPEVHHSGFGFGAEHADGLLYLSKHSQNLFESRFSTSKSIIKDVYFQSCSLTEYVMKCVPPVERRTLFVVGNELRHKDVGPTAELLADAFPFEEIVCLGRHHVRHGAIRQVDSGDLTQEAIGRLYNEAKVVVYPSFYEGFGIPIMEGLANGAVVIARWSPLLEELAANLPAKCGALVCYRSPRELVTIMDDVLSSRPYPRMTTGAALASSQKPLSRKDVAEKVVRFSQRMVAGADGSRWRTRDRLFRQTRQF